jgi:hypothetical protein
MNPAPVASLIVVERNSYANGQESVHPPLNLCLCIPLDDTVAVACTKELHQTRSRLCGLGALAERAIDIHIA